MRLLILLTAFLLLSHQTIAVAKQIFYHGTPETILLHAEKSALVRFPLPIKTISNASDFIIGPADSKKPDFRLVSVKPRSVKAKGQVTFVMADDSTIEVRLLTRKRSHIPQFYDILIDSKSALPQAQAKLDELDLMKAMIKGHRPLGFEVVERDTSIETGLKHAKGKLIRVYGSPYLVGYEFWVENTSYEYDLAIDVKSISFGSKHDIVLSQVDRKILLAKTSDSSKRSKTYLRLVAKPSFQAKSLKLPVASIKALK